MLHPSRHFVRRRSRTAGQRRLAVFISLGVWGLGSGALGGGVAEAIAQPPVLPVVKSAEPLAPGEIEAAVPAVTDNDDSLGLGVEIRWDETPGLGTTVAGQAERLTQLAVDQHPELAFSQSDVARQAGLRLQATRKPNPWFGYSASEVGNEGRAGQQGLYLSQEWVTAGKLELAGQEGAWQTRAASERVAQARLRLAARVESQYWLMVAARHRVTLLNQLEELLQDGVKTNEALRSAEEVGLGPVLQAKLEKNQVAVAKRQAEADLRARTGGLAATVGVPYDFVEQIPSDPWPTMPAPEQVQASNDWQSSPLLAESQALAEAARWNLRLAQVQIISNVDSSASVQHDAVTDNVVVGLQVGMAIPVHDRKTGLVRAARAEVAQNEAEYSRRYRDLQNRWADAVGQYRSAVEMVNAIEQDLLALAEQRLDLARQAFQQGEADYLELLTAQRSFLAIRQSALDARQQATMAAISIRYLVPAN